MKEEGEAAQGVWKSEPFGCLKHCYPHGKFVHRNVLSLGSYNILPVGIQACICPCLPLARVSARTKCCSFYAVLLLTGILGLAYWLANIPFEMIFSQPPRIMKVFRYIRPFFGEILYPVVLIGTTYLLRNKIRRARNINGSNMDDCLMSTFCNCCTITQIAVEVDNTVQIV